MRCEYCDKYFTEDDTCLASYLMHKIVKHPKQIIAKEGSNK